MPTVETKKQFGQFFTVNSDYVLQNLEKYVKGKNTVDPFAGNGELLNWALEHGAHKAKGFDVDKSLVDNELVFFNDSILKPKSYDFVITNPPYLNVNKARSIIKEQYFNNSEYEDLYQISLDKLMDSKEGIVIVPINFLSAENSSLIRKKFFARFAIVEMNYFKDQVFPDTTYNVIAFHYKRKAQSQKGAFTIKTHIYPAGKVVPIELSEKYSWLIGGDVVSKINAQENFLHVRRLTEEDMEENRGNISIECAYNHVSEKRVWRISEEFLKKIESNTILLKAIDSGSEDGKIALEDIRNYGVSCLVSKPTSRHMIYLIFGRPISIAEQKKLIKLFNTEMEHLRHKYMSLFLTNYRDKDRKRIGFDFAYKFINYLYDKHIHPSRLF